MKDVLRGNNPVYISWAQALLEGAGIAAVIFDTHASVVEGSVTAIEKRLMVAGEDYERAVALIREHEPPA